MANPQPGRIHTTHVGSLIRPAQLIALLRAKADVVNRQIQIGIDIVSDGEFGKSISWSRYILECMTGFAQRPDEEPNGTMRKSVFGKDRREFAEFYAEYDKTQNFAGMRGWSVVGPIAYKGKAQIERDITSLNTVLNAIPIEDAFLSLKDSDCPLVK